MQSVIDTISEKISNLLADHADKFLVEVLVKPTNNIKVFIDGNNGITIRDIASLNRALYNQIEEEGMFKEDDFSLEVSSPGIDEPLKLHRQYIKNSNKNVVVTLSDNNTLEGKMAQVTATDITIE